MHSKYHRLIFALLAVFVYGSAIADIIWPSAILEAGVISWWVIVAGILIEWPFVKGITKRTWLVSLVATLGINALSTLLGFFLIPFSGLAWEFTGGSLVNRAFNVGTFNPATWVASLLLAALVNTLVEGLSLSLAFRIRRASSFGLLFMANCPSVAVAFVEITWHRPRT